MVSWPKPRRILHLGEGKNSAARKENCSQMQWLKIQAGGSPWGQKLQVEDDKNGHQNRRAELVYLLHPACRVFVRIQIMIPGQVEIIFGPVRPTGRKINSLRYVG